MVVTAVVELMTAVPVVIALTLAVVIDGTDVGNGTVVSTPAVGSAVTTVPTVDGWTEVDAVCETATLRLIVVVVTVGTGVFREIVKVQKCGRRPRANSAAMVEGTEHDSAAKTASTAVNDLEVAMLGRYVDKLCVEEGVVEYAIEEVIKIQDAGAEVK